MASDSPATTASASAPEELGGCCLYHCYYPERSDLHLRLDLVRGLDQDRALEEEGRRTWWVRRLKKGVCVG